MMNDLAIYEEKQTMKLWWVWLITFALTAFMWYSAIMQLIFNKPVGTNPGSDSFMLIFWILFGILFPLFIITFDLLITVDNDKIYISSTNRIIFNRTILLNDIEEVSIKTYNPFAEYGGWGNRGFKKNKAYTIDGNKGLMLLLKDGSKVLIGTKKPDEFLQAVKSVI